jgi:hypothetical protein
MGLSGRGRILYGLRFGILGRGGFLLLGLFALLVLGLFRCGSCRMSLIAREETTLALAFGVSGDIG